MKLLNDLIKSNSYEGDYTGIIAVIKDFVQSSTEGRVIEQSVTDKKSNLIVCFGAPQLVINCHMDTVIPAGAWDQPPLHLYQDEERLYGLGTADTKGNIYMVLKAVEAAKPKDLMLLFSIDEESGSKTGVQYFLDSDYGKDLKAAIVCEPTSLVFANRHKGVYSYYVEHRTEGGHSSIKAESAVVEAAKDIIALDAQGFNIGKVECANASNVVAQNCRFKASVRTYEEPEAASDRIRKISRKGIIIASFIGRPLENDRPHISGADCELDFWTEAPLFQNAGINAVVFGAGNIRQAHKINEYVEIQQLSDGQKIIEKIIGEEK
jgi:acetylornithine deacetylase